MTISQTIGFIFLAQVGVVLTSGCLSGENDGYMLPPTQEDVSMINHRSDAGVDGSPLDALPPSDMELILTSDSTPPLDHDLENLDGEPPPTDLSVEDQVDFEIVLPDMEMTSVCGDGVQSPDESCDEPDPECVDCRIYCSYQGGRACGGNTIPGNPQLLYECDGTEFVVIEDCGQPCQRMPSGVPDRCPDVSEPSDPPARLLETLRATPYVEQDCSPTTFTGWPYQAKRCNYTTGGLASTVITATPSPRRVSLWLMDSVEMIPSLVALKDTDYSSYTEGLVMIAVAVLNQSSRIFPLSGDIVENLGGGYTRYPFDRGVTAGCSSGCYCRINSLHRTEWCAYVGSIGGDENACLDQIGRSGLTQAWGDQCLQNHIDAWESTRNEHFRARALQYKRSIRSTCPRADSCTPQQVLNALRDAINGN